MKNIQISSPETDREVLLILRKVMLVSLWLAIPALVGFLLPVQVYGLGIHIIGALYSVALGVFAWGLFGIISPVWLSRDWRIAKAIAIPILWLCFVVTLGLFFSGLRERVVFESIVIM